MLNVFYRNLYILYVPYILYIFLPMVSLFSAEIAHSRFVTVLCLFSTSRGKYAFFIVFN